jgi:putative nucleotide binding protein
MIPAEKRYEEFAYALDYVPRGKSSIIKGREGPLVQALGEERLTLLELLAVENESFEVGEKLRIGREGRAKIVSVFGKLAYEDLTSDAKAQLLGVCELIVKNNESRYVAYFNELQPLTPRLHGLELIPGIGKTFMKTIIETRERQPFTSFDDVQTRVGLREPAKLVAKRIAEELSGASRINIFVKK